MVNIKESMVLWKSVFSCYGSMNFSGGVMKYLYIWENIPDMTSFQTYIDKESDFVVQMKFHFKLCLFTSLGFILTG